MTDISIAWTPAGARGDWQVAAGQLVGGSDLETAVLVSLFTDRVVSPEEIPPGADRRGWWGDTYREQPIGSRLWTLARRAKSNATVLLADAKDMCIEALNWMIGDGVAASLQVQTYWITGDAMGIVVTIREPSKTSPTQFRYSWAWKGI